MRACLTPPAAHWPQLPDSLSLSLTPTVVCARATRVCARTFRSAIIIPRRRPTSHRLFASFFDGKTARKCARVCRMLAERAATHEDLRAPVVAKAVSKAHLYISNPEVKFLLGVPPGA